VSASIASLSTVACLKVGVVAVVASDEQAASVRTIARGKRLRAYI
jgi:hypothetical protein